MKNTGKRLFLFFLAIPLLIMLILYLPGYGHLGVIILLTAVGLLCGLEMRAILSGIAGKLPAWTILIPTLAAPLAWLVNMGWVTERLPVYFITAGVLWALIGAVFVKKEELSAGLVRMSSRLLMLIYPGWFLWWVARLTWFGNAGVVILVFMLTVYLNDSLAWFFGIIMGRHRNLIAVSPNKSLEGFIGGTLASVGVVLIAARIRPDILPHPLWQLLLFGIAAAFTTITGDLVESALKRSAGVKDSGRIIPGRGGMLDSIDSVLLTAPVFVLFLQMVP